MTGHGTSDILTGGIFVETASARFETIARGRTASRPFDAIDNRSPGAALVSIDARLSSTTHPYPRVSGLRGRRHDGV